ncbi:hypothetical protein HPG69_006614 [Diceros bicornis minor]|uniref:Uncharacterized protein n=1 Tax=Diceros bicornis minor TaxID=77932 RepID=A0A7J7F5X7_DICBM|nr:hypothetical protein HPG69_006614 [Diceros bicornis minor]
MLCGRFPGQAVPLTPTPGTRGPGPAKRAPLPPAPSPHPSTSLGRPGSPSCPQPAIHSQAILEKSSDFTSMISHSNSQTICHDPEDPAHISGGPYLICWPGHRRKAILSGHTSEMCCSSASAAGSHPQCGPGAGNHPDATHNTQVYLRLLHREDERERGRDPQTEGRSSSHREAGRPGRGPDNLGEH